MSEELKNILIIKPSALGDIVMALPALSALRRNFPDAKISWLVRPEFAGLLEGHPHLDSIIEFDRRYLGRAWCKPAAMGSLFSLVRRLRRSKFDAVIDLQGLFRTASLGWLTGSKKRFGMADAREFAPIFYNHKIPPGPDRVHVVDYYLKIVRAVGASDTAAEFILPQSSRADESVEKLLAANNIKANNYAVLIPGSAHDYKCWPAENFAAIADRMAADFGFDIVAVGTAGEKVIIENLKSAADFPVAEFAGRTSISELISLLRSARAVVTNDTGPGHIAGVLDVPLAMIYGRSNPIRIYPYKTKDSVVAVEPFDRGLALNSPEARHDIKEITVEQVYGKIREQMKQKGTLV